MEDNHGETNRAAPLELLVLNEAVAICEKLESAFRHKGDECHNNNGVRTKEDWERMDKFLVASADDIRKVKQDVKNLVAFYPRHESKKACMSNDAVFGNVAAMREALVSMVESETEGSMDRDDLCGRCLDKMWDSCKHDGSCWVDKVINALSVPPRNCDVEYVDRVAMYGAFKDWCKSKGHTMEPMLAYDAFDWLLAPVAGLDGGRDGTV